VLCRCGSVIRHFRASLYLKDGLSIQLHWRRSMVSRKAVKFESTNSASDKALYVYRLLVHDQVISPVAARAPNDQSPKFEFFVFFATSETLYRMAIGSTSVPSNHRGRHHRQHPEGPRHHTPPLRFQLRVLAGGTLPSRYWRRARYRESACIRGDPYTLIAVYRRLAR
jgi:hypothetical protein